MVVDTNEIHMLTTIAAPITIQRTTHAGATPPANAVKSLSTQLRPGAM